MVIAALRISVAGSTSPTTVQSNEDNWQELALCAQTDPDAFFPDHGGSVREAKRICQSCSVKAPCLEAALTNDERFGVWGGLSDRERHALSRARN